MSTNLLPCIERTIGTDPRLSVIWLHGLGASGHDFEPVVDALDLRGGFRFVFPHAPRRPVTINGGSVMPAWFDIRSLDGRGSEDAAGIAAGTQAVLALVEREMQFGFPPANIVLAGFSQGGALALHVGLRARQAFAGILALSTYLPCAGSLEGEKSEANSDVPIFMAHGDMDPVIRLDFADSSRQHLEAAGYRVEWKTYPMAHEVIATELRDISRWLCDRHAAASSQRSGEMRNS